MEGQKWNCLRLILASPRICMVAAVADAAKSPQLCPTALTDV